MPGRNKLRAYWCFDCRFWHVGHLPATIRKGRHSRREIYPEDAA